MPSVMQRSALESPFGISNLDSQVIVVLCFLITSTCLCTDIRSVLLLLCQLLLNDTLTLKND